MNEKALSRKITTELASIHSTLTKSLETFYQKKIKNSTFPIETIRSQYDQEIKNLIRNTVQSSWLFSHQILTDIVTIKIPKFQINISVQDIQGIEAATDKANEAFWTKSGELQLRDADFFKVNTKSELEQLDPLDIHAAFIALGLFAAFYAYNEGIKSKTSELGLTTKLKFVTRENCVDTQLCIPLRGIYNVGEFPYVMPIHKHCKCRLIPVVV